MPWRQDPLLVYISVDVELNCEDILCNFLSFISKRYKRKDCKFTCLMIFIAGTLGCVFIDNETHESGVTKCTTSEAWSAFSWHHSSVFHCQWTHNQVFLLLSYMLIWNAKSIFIYMMKYVSGFIWKLGINLQFVSSGLTKLYETIGYCWCPIVMRWSLWLQQWSLWLHHCDVIHWDKQSCVTMAVDL